MDLLLASVNTTTTAAPSLDDDHTPISIGYIYVVVSVLFFGSNYVPAAQYPIGDSFSFQFFLCCGIWITGVVIDLIVKSPTFFPLIMIGGVVWTTGNILSVYAVRINGLGMSMLLWCTTSMFMGWASGHFGWFSLTPENVEKPSFNYIGVAIACLSGVIFLAIRTVKLDNDIEEKKPSVHSAIQLEDNGPAEAVQQVDTVVLSTVTIRMRIIGSLLAIIAGFLFGLVFTPSTYIQDHRKDKYPSASKNGLHYVFAMYSGILLSSFVYYVVYIIVKRNRPYVHVQSIFPGFVSGIMWGIAQAGFLVANGVLSQAISFPLLSIGPATIGTLWSVLYFKDISGARNYLLVVSGTLLRIVAAILIILSKPTSN